MILYNASSNLTNLLSDGADLLVGNVLEWGLLFVVVILPFCPLLVLLMLFLLLKKNAFHLSLSINLYVFWYSWILYSFLLQIGMFFQEYFISTFSKDSVLSTMFFKEASSFKVERSRYFSVCY